MNVKALIGQPAAVILAGVDVSAVVSVSVLAKLVADLIIVCIVPCSVMMYAYQSFSAPLRCHPCLPRRVRRLGACLRSPLVLQSWVCYPFANQSIFF